MSRNSSGTYSLPAGNPVVTGTTITSSWANTTLSDIASALTDSLSRTGQGGMQAGLPLADGTSALPGLAWGTDLTSGLYRAGSVDHRWVNGTVELLQLTTNLFRVSGTAPIIRWNETDAAANNRLWDVIASGEALSFRVLTDALVADTWLIVQRTGGSVDSLTFDSPATTFTSGGTVQFTGTTTHDATATFTQSRGVAGQWGVYINANDPFFGIREADAAANNRLWSIGASGEQFRISLLDDAESTSNTFFAVDRTGTTIDTINFPNGTLQYGGVEVGYKGFPQNSENTNFNITNTYAGVITYYTSTGHTGTIQASFTALTGGTTTIANHGTGNLTIATASGTLQWLNGTGAVSTGSRTLAVGGVCTITVRNGTGNPYIWGTGLS